MRWFLLVVLAIPAQCNQLEKLISFANAGGQNPSGSSRPNGIGRPQAPPAPRARPRAPSRNIISPIPFSEPADPGRRTVPIDLPQPPRSRAPQGFAAPRIEIPDPAPKPKGFSGLPPGAVQIGGRPVQLPRRRKPDPVPLSEINPPIHRSTQFPSLLNDIDPLFAPVPEPAEALRHNFLPGQVPRPVPVPRDRLPVIDVIQNFDQRQRRPSIDPQVDRFADQVFNQDVFIPSQQQNGRFLPPPPQNLESEERELNHAQALQKHRDEVERVKKIQQLSAQRQGLPLPPQQQPFQQPLQPQPFQQPIQPQFQQPPKPVQNPFQQNPFQHQQFQQPPIPLQQQFQQPAQHQHIPQQQSSHFNIPGGDRHRQFADELRLAQEALKALG